MGVSQNNIYAYRGELWVGLKNIMNYEIIIRVVFSFFIITSYSMRNEPYMK